MIGQLLSGLFGGGAPLTQGINGNQGIPTQQQPQQGQLPAPQGSKGLFGGKHNNTLGVLGAAFKDVGNAGESNHLGAFQQQQQEFAKQAQQRALIQQATQGLSPQAAAAFALNPQAGSSAQIANALPNQLQVQAGQRAQQAQTFGQNRQTQQDAAKAQQQQLNNQFRQNGQQIQQDQFGQSLGQRQQQAGVQQDQFAQQQAFRQQQATAQQANADRSFGLQSDKLAASQQQGPLSVSDQVALQREARNQQEFSREEKDRQAADRTSEFERRQTVSLLDRLRPAGLNQDGTERDAGDLNKGLRQAFGASKLNPFTLAPGSERNAASGAIKQVVSNLTLDKIANFKGAISDKDLEIAQGAATRLQSNISDKEAKKALDELFTAFGGQAPPQTQGAAQAPQVGQSQGGYVFLGGDPSDQNNWKRQ